MFLSASPPGTLTVTSWLVGDTRSPGKTQGRQHNTPRLSQEENLDCFGSVTSHLLMKNFKPELFSYELEVGQHMKNHESGVSDSFFYVVLFLM